jgi:hypothetical protein
MGISINTITIYDYNDARHGTAPRPSGARRGVKKYVVEAFCVNGPEGVRAYFMEEDIVCVAAGDDGHWWLLETYHEHWLPFIIEALSQLVNREGNPVERDKKLK